MGDEWLVDENIDVDIQQLKDFATAIQNELDTNFRPSFENGVRPMLTVQAPFGSGGLKEGAFFRGRHDESRMAVSHLLGDAMKGLVSLSMAASSISAEYLTGDALSQATSDDVYSAFSGIDGQKTLNDYWQQDSGDQTDPSAAVPAEALEPTTYYGPESCVTGDSREDTPEGDQRQVIAEGTTGEHVIEADDEDLYGEDVRLDQSTLGA